ncbi:hypothetical protein E3N88_19735 [Mikania micrantha]|uniref:PPM-type phosphatase domain-containing protein n=1 Tax=Mikania micrantha TaxID=192012 RepID=A0A5N6NQE6_9ASTR|nr:hypothetical protein E3N88_19735 [Mikania micrantha]
MKNSSVRYGCAAQSRKGEEYFIMKTDRQRIHGNPISSFSVFGLHFVMDFVEIVTDWMALLLAWLIVASDGIWDALSSEIAAESCRDLFLPRKTHNKLWSMLFRTKFRGGTARNRKLSTNSRL